MKKIIAILTAAVLIFPACSRKKHTAKKGKEERIEIVTFFREKVMVQDLHKIDTNLYYVEKEEFLSEKDYGNFKSSMWSLIRNPNAKVYNWIDQQATAVELKDRVVFCDSVQESTFDAKGVEVITSRFMCDSVSAMNNLSMVYFYESWYLNTKTNLIEKETLGYSVYQYVKSKEAFRELFFVFRDDEAREKCKKYYFSY